MKTCRVCQLLLLAVVSSEVHGWRLDGTSTKSCTLPGHLLLCTRGGGDLDSNANKSPSWSFASPCHSMSWTPMASTRLCILDNPQDMLPSLQDHHDVDNEHLIVVGITRQDSDSANNMLEESVMDVVPNGDNLRTTKQQDGSSPSATDSFHVGAWGPMTRSLDEELQGFLTQTLQQALGEDSGLKLGSTLDGGRVSIPKNDGTFKNKRIVMVDMTGDDSRKVARTIGKTVASLLKSEKKRIGKCDLLFPHCARQGDFVFELSTSLLTELYADERFKSKPKESKVTETVRLVFDTQSQGTQGDTTDTNKDECTEKELQEALDSGQALASGVYLAKDIVNCPHNTLNSHGLADTAKRIATKYKLKCRILEQAECEKRNMGAYLGVARGSETMPKFIHLTYRPKRTTRQTKLRKLGIVGKGLLMDTGGYNIKTSMMELMKFDCGGAAAVLGAAMAIGALKPQGVEVHFVVAACENMINERAVVPGDVLTASNGKTIEVINTDAEGRLTLADALVYADKELHCDEIIELSTLTGACMMALGSVISGLFTNHNDLAESLQDASSRSGEKLWRMPMETEYKDQLKSKIADLRNLGGRYPGAIVAALFLQNFVNPSIPFAHVDMAGPVWHMKNGATGYGVKLITEWVCQQGNSNE